MPVVIYLLETREVERIVRHGVETRVETIVKFPSASTIVDLMNPFDTIIVITHIFFSNYVKHPVCFSFGHQSFAIHSFIHLPIKPPLLSSPYYLVNSYKSQLKLQLFYLYQLPCM